MKKFRVEEEEDEEEEWAGVICGCSIFKIHNICKYYRNKNNMMLKNLNLRILMMLHQQSNDYY